MSSHRSILSTGDAGLGRPSRTSMSLRVRGSPRPFPLSVYGSVRTAMAVVATAATAITASAQDRVTVSLERSGRLLLGTSFRA